MTTPLAPQFRRSTASLPELCLSAVDVRFAVERFCGRERPYEGEEVFRELRKRENAFVYRNKGKPESTQVLEIPLDADGATATELFLVRDHLPALARLVESRLVALLPRFELRPTKWGLERIRRNDDLLDAAFRRLGRDRPQVIDGIHKFHRTVFRVRSEFIPGRGSGLVLTIEFRRHQEVMPTVAELVERGFDLSRIEVFERGADERRRWLGTIRSARRGEVIIDGDDGELVVDGATHWPEASNDTFDTLLSHALGQQGYERLLEAEWVQRASEVCGQGYVTRLGQVADYLRRAGSLEVAPGLRFAFGEVVPLEKRTRPPAVATLPDVEYCFSWDRSAIESFPAVGLEKHGPFDGTTFDTKEPRLLVVCPDECRSDVDQFVRRLRDGTTGNARNPFARGLVGTYRLTKLPTRFAAVPLTGVTRDVGARYVQALKRELGNEKPPDIALVVLRDEDAFVTSDNPYLAAKAFLLRQGIPSQEVRLSKVRSAPSDLPYILRDIAVAMYAKLGGCPWTIRPTMPLTREVVIGMAHAEFGSRYSTRRRFMGITTVFNSDGAYLLAAGSPRCRYDEYPEVLANSVRDTLSRLATEQGWSAGDMVRLVFHSPKPLTGKEISRLALEAVATLGKEIQFESAFLTIETDHPLKVVAPHEKGRERFVDLLAGGRGRAMVGTCVPKRGTIVDLGRWKRLLCVNGPLLMKREGESLPQPLQIELHRSSTYTDLSALARQVFHFTGLSWRSMLPVTEPVTILYPHLIARMLGKLSALPDWSDDLLDTRLRRSRWFL